MPDAEGEELKVDGHVPHACRQRFVVCHAVQQQCVGDQLGDIWVSGHRGVIEPGRTRALTSTVTSNATT